MPVVRSEMAKVLTDYKPTDRQRKLLKVLQAASYKLTVKGACKQADVSPQRYYRWFNNADFRAWWTGHYERFFALQLPRIHNAIVRSDLGQNKDGNPQAMKLALERFDKGYVPASKREIEGTLALTYEQELEELEKAAAAEVAADEAPDGIDGDKSA